MHVLQENGSCHSPHKACQHIRPEVEWKSAKSKRYPKFISFCLGSLLESMNMSAMFTWAKCLHFGSSETVIITIKRKLAFRILSLIPFWAMSGFTPIEFTKAATKEGGRIPTNEEKDADALQRVAAAFGSAPETKADSANPGPQLIAGEASGSGLMKPESMAADLAASFDPSAAAGAINAVIVPPTSAAGLEDGVEHMEIDKKSDDDWMIADPVPLTETEMVGSFLQDQEKKDREQYVFLTQEDANMETVNDHLSDLTEHIHRLSVGDFQKDVVGPQTDGPSRVEVEPAGDGLFRLTCFPEPFPHVSRYVSSLLGGLAVQEVAQLFDIFRGKPLTRAGVERALECYILKKRSMEHGKLLSRKFLKPSDKRGLGYGEMKEAHAGEAMEMMCPTCLTPRDPEKKKCLFCKSTEEAVHYTQPMASMLVDGKLWELRFDADGTYHWEAEGVTQEEKDAAMVDISSLAQSPSPSMGPREASFADQVPQSFRIKLRDQVVTHAPDPALLEALAKRNEKPSPAWGGQEWGSEGLPPWSGQGDEAEGGHALWSHRTPTGGPCQDRGSRHTDDRSPGGDAKWGPERGRQGGFGSQGAQTVGHGALQRVLEEKLLGRPRGQYPASSNQHRESQRAEPGATGPWTEDGGRPPPHPRTTVLLVRSSQSSIRAECLRPGVWDGRCDGHWPWGGDHRVQGDEGLPADKQHEAICPQVVLWASRDSSEGTGSRWTDGGTSPPGLQACTPHTDVQSPLRWTSPVWWSLEVGLGTFQSTQVGQAAETGGADSPRNPDAPSWLEELELHPVPLHGGGREEAGWGWFAASSRFYSWRFLGPLWWGALLAEADPDLDPACFVPRLRQQLDDEGALRHLVWDAPDDPTLPQGARRNTQATPGHFAEDQGWGATVPGCEQLGKAPVPGRVASMLQGIGQVLGNAGFPDQHATWCWRFRWPPSQMTESTWSWGPSVMSESASPWTPSRSTQRFTSRLWTFFLQTSSWMWRWPGDATPRSTGMLKWMPLLQDLSMPSWATPPQPSKPWTWTPLAATWTWRPRVPSSWGRNQLIAVIRTREHGRAAIPLLHSSPLRVTMAKIMKRNANHPSLWTTWSPLVGRTTWGRAIRGASAMPSGGAWNVAWFWAVSAPGKWSKKRRVWHVEAIAANGARVFGRERWGAPAFSRSPRGMWSFRWSWMSPLSASTTDGSRTASSSTSGWNQQLLSAMCPWRLIPTRCTAWGSASPMGWAMWVMPFGTLCWRILRRPAWKASTMWRTSTSGTECIRGGHLPFCLLLFLHWGSWILLVARWFFCNTGDHDVSP